MKKIIKKSNNTLFYVFIGVVVIAGLSPIIIFVSWIGSNYFYERYAPTDCNKKLIQTNMMQPPIQIGTKWTDGGVLYFMPQEVYVGSGGYATFAKEIDKTTCQQYITVKGSLIFRQNTIDTPINQSVLTIDLQLTEPTRETEPYLITKTLEYTFLPFAPTIEGTKNTRAMKFSRTILEKSLDDPTDLAYKNGTGMITEINGQSTYGETIFITQVNGIWNVRTDTQ